MEAKYKTYRVWVGEKACLVNAMNEQEAKDEVLTREELYTGRKGKITKVEELRTG